MTYADVSDSLYTLRFPAPSSYLDHLPNAIFVMYVIPFLFYTRMLVFFSWVPTLSTSVSRYMDNERIMCYPLKSWAISRQMLVKTLRSHFIPNAMVVVRGGGKPSSH